MEAQRRPCSEHTYAAIVPINQQRAQNFLAADLSTLLQHPYSLALTLGALHDVADLVRADELEDGPKLVGSRNGGSFDDIELERCGRVFASDAAVGGMRGRGLEEVQNLGRLRVRRRVEQRQDVEGFVLRRRHCDGQREGTHRIRGRGTTEAHTKRNMVGGRVLTVRALNSVGGCCRGLQRDALLVLACVGICLRHSHKMKPV